MFIMNLNEICTESFIETFQRFLKYKDIQVKIFTVEFFFNFQTLKSSFNYNFDISFLSLFLLII